MSTMFDGMGRIIDGMFVALAICVPLGIWKMIDIVIWVCRHLQVHVQ